MLLTAPARPGPSLAARRSTPGQRIACRTRAAIGAVSAAFVLVAVVAVVAIPGVARADSGPSITAATNQARQAAGRAPLMVSGELVAAATAHAQAMASSGVLAHTVHLGSTLCCWQTVGENVGRGSSAALIEAAFLASPEHRANILGAYTEIGIGYAVDRHGQVWISELFRLPATAAVQPPAVSPKPVTPKPPTHVVAKPTRKPAPIKVAVTSRPALAVAAAPPAVTVVAAAEVGPDLSAASRSLTRVPIDAAHRLAAQLSHDHAITGTNPISRLLDFAAQAAAAN